MTNDVLGPEYGRAQSGDPGTLSYIQDQLSRLAPYDFQLVVEGHANLIIEVASDMHQRDMEDIMRQHRDNLLPAPVSYRVDISRDMQLAQMTRPTRTLTDDRVVTHDKGDYLEFDFLAGTHLHQAIDYMVSRSSGLKRTVATKFNGRWITIGSTDKSPRTAEAPKMRRRINLGDE